MVSTRRLVASSRLTIRDGRLMGRSLIVRRGDVPAAFRLSDLIEGWIIALQQMCIGDRWEVYLPAELAYGRYAQPGIPAGSTLIFELELVSIA